MKICTSLCVIALCFCFAEVPGHTGKPSFSDMTNTSVRLSWTPPEDNGGAPITNYNIEYKMVDGFKWNRATLDYITEETYVITKLSKDTEYVFRVNAENKVGAGPWKESHEAVRIMEHLGELSPFEGRCLH
jgi:titin